MVQLQLKYVSGTTIALYDRVVLINPSTGQKVCVFERTQAGDKPALIVYVDDPGNRLVQEYIRLELDPQGQTNGWKTP